MMEDDQTELGPIDLKKGYKRHVFSGYNKTNSKIVKKYKQLPQENILVILDIFICLGRIKIEEDLIESELDR